jgi:16S rRNA (uracil1498-N3)-methyltransferase
VTDAARKPRFFVSNLPAPGEGGIEIELPPIEARHAAGVLRLRAGDAVELTDGRGHSAEATLAEVRKRTVRAAIGQVRQWPRPRPMIHVASAIAKGKRQDWMLEKLAELAVASIRPVRFERSVAGEGTFSEGKRSRWAGHLVAACKQSGSNFLPELTEPRGLDAFLDEQPFEGVLLVGDLTDDAVEMSDAIPPDAEEVTILVGPEGGFTDSERGKIVRAGFQPVRLGPGVLRIETAAVALTAGAWAVGGGR